MGLFVTLLDRFKNHIFMNANERKNFYLVTNRKYASKQGNRIGVRFIKYDIQGVFLKSAEILPTRLFDNVED
jgi:hypothetical protein